MPPEEEPPLSPAELEALERLKKQWDYKPLDAVSGAFTAGADLRFAVADFGRKHYEQEDTSLNSVLWSLWPTDAESIEGCIEKDQAKADRRSGAELRADHRFFKPLREYFPESPEPRYDQTKLAEALPYAERARVGYNVRLLNTVHMRMHETGLLPIDNLSEGMSPLHLLSARKKLFDVPPLAEAITKGKVLMERGDRLSQLALKRGTPEYNADPAQTEEGHKHAIAAAGLYCSALMGCWPWTASGLIMSPETAFEGLAQLEASLWKKLSNTLLQLINYKPQSRGMYFNVLARLCNLVPLLTRYAPHSTHSKCHGDMMMLVLTLPSMDFGYEAAMGMEMMVMGVVYGNGSGDTWAHAGCRDRHVSCTLEGMSEAEMEKRSKEQLENIRKRGSKQEDQGAPKEEATAEDEGGEETKYFDRQGKVVGTGPKLAMRMQGMCLHDEGEAGKAAKPAFPYPCD